MDIGLAVDAVCIPLILLSCGVTIVAWSYDMPLPRVVELPLHVQRRMRVLFCIAIKASIAVLVLAALFFMHRLPFSLFPLTIVVATIMMVCETAILRLRRYQRII